MDSDSLFPPAHRDTSLSWRQARWPIFIFALLIYGVVLARHVGAYAGGSDSSGYLNNARLLRERQVHAPQRSLAELPPAKMPKYSYIPLGFVPAGEGQMVPTYPIGLPMLVIATSSLTGWNAAPHVTMWLHGMIGVVLMFALARQAGLSPDGAAFGALLLACSPLYFFMSLQAMSDVPALVWATAAVAGAWQSRKHPAWGCLAGAAFAIAVLVRPTNMLAIVPIAIAIGPAWRQWVALIAGGLPGAVVLAVYNRAAYGSPFTSGYGSVLSPFTREVVGTTLIHYARWLPVLLTPLCLLTLGLPWIFRSEARRWALLLTSWILVFGSVYAFYFHTHEAWWYLRFLLPAFPALILASLLVGRRIVEHRLGFATRENRSVSARGLGALGSVIGSPLGIAGGVLLVLLWSGYWNQRLGCLKFSRSEASYQRSAVWAIEHLPPDTILMAMQTSGALHYYTDFMFLRWDQLDLKASAAVEQVAAETKRPLVAMLFPFEEHDALEKRVPGRWTKIATVEQSTFWRWAGPASAP